MRRLSRASSRGSALLLAVIIALVASIATATFLFRAERSAQFTADLLGRRRAFYVADGMSRMVVREVQSLMISNPNPSTEDLKNPNKVQPPEVDGYELETYDVRSTGDAFEGIVPNGPWESMNANQKPISIDIVAREAGGEYAADVHLRVMLGQVSMFQFFVFGAGYTDILPGPNMVINPGRVHANGDLCLGGGAVLEVERVTASGRLLATESRCRRTNGSGPYVWNGTSYIQMTSSNSNGCVNCAGSGQKWRAYSTSTWKGHARDSAHGVPMLRLPVTGTPRTQAGQNASAVAVSNATSTRLLVDPVLTTDSQDILDQKFAWQADIRILNGVWYVNDGTWPGAAIWSDHPGEFTTRNEEGIEGLPRPVGQAQLSTQHGWTRVPRRYSYYEYDTSTSRLLANDQGVVSYGTLAKGTSSWKPGYWITGPGTRTYTDVDGKSKTYFCNACSNATGCSVALSMKAAADVFCQYNASGSWLALKDSQYLQAARSGFIDYRVRNSSASKSLILPQNFDVSEFAAALQDVTPGELGSYFNGGRDFNGIIYISNTWSGSMGGLPNGLATLWPDQGAISDPIQINIYNTTSVQRGLPYALCSENLGYVAGTRRVGLSGPPSDGSAANGFEPNFSIPSCTATISGTSRPNAVRVINAATVSSTLFPKGLSIVTNLPMYVQGNFNTSSDSSSATATPWIPVMVGADAVSLLSNAWEDKNSAWNNSSAYTARKASATTYRLELLGGTVETSDSTHYSGGVENFPRFLENWSGVTATVAGSFVVGYASVYQRQAWFYGTPVYDAPTRAWSFDNHLKTLANQPPGAPRFSIHSVSRLNRVAASE